MGKRSRRRAKGIEKTPGRSAPVRPSSPGPAGPQAVGSRTLAAIFAAALAIRLIHVWQLGASPFADLLMGDSAGYDRWARDIAGGNWLGSDIFYQAPLYPYLLGIVYSLFGPDVTMVRICQAALGAGSCVLLAAGAGRFFNRRVGVAAGLVLAFYAPAIFVDATVQKSVVDLFLLSGALWLVSRTLDGQSPGRTWIGIGLWLGALCLTRENALVLIAALVPWLWLQRSERSDWIRSAALIAAGVAAMLVPVAARNAYVGGEWHLTTSQLGPNLYIGNNAESDGTYRALRYGRGDPLFERDDATELAQAALGRSLTPGEVSGYWVGRVVDDVTAAPGRWIRLLGRKAALTVNAVEVIDTESQYAHAEYSTSLAGLGWLTHFGVLIPLAALGMAVTWPARRRLLPLYLMAVFYAASVVAFYVFARYRFPLAPFAILFAVAGADHVIQVARGRATVPRAPIIAAAVVVTAVAANWPLLATTSMRATSYNNLATAYRERGDLATAIDLYRRALALDPAYAQAHSNLGSALAASGDPDSAISHYEEALASDAGRGDFRFNFGNALLALGRYTEAEEQFRQALASWPEDAEALNNLGMALGSMGRMTEAADAFRESVRIDPAGALAHRNLAVALEELGDAAGARHHLAEAERLEGTGAGTPQPR